MVEDERSHTYERDGLDNRYNLVLLRNGGIVSA